MRWFVNNTGKLEKYKALYVIFSHKKLERSQEDPWFAALALKIAYSWLHTSILKILLSDLLMKKALIKYLVAQVNSSCVLHTGRVQIAI